MSGGQFSRSEQNRRNLDACIAEIESCSSSSSSELFVSFLSCFVNLMIRYWYEKEERVQSGSWSRVTIRWVDKFSENMDEERGNRR